MSELIVALVDDLMDRSRISAAFPDATFAKTSGDGVGAAVVIVDLGRSAASVAEVRDLAPRAVIVAFGSHVDDEAFERARTDGADAVLARSRFFRDPAAAVEAARHPT